MKRKPTQNDVAALAGVSNATVSNAINGTKYVGDDVRAKIEEAIAKLNYIPNSLAKSLRVNESRLIGLIIWDIQNPGLPPIVRGVEDVLGKNGFNVLLCNTDSEPEKERHYLNVLLGRRVDGLIVSLSGLEITHFRDLSIPVVFFNRVPETDDCNVVITDNIQGAYIATEHLVQHGYRRIAIIAGMQSVSVGRDRLRGYREALAAGDVSCDPNLVKICDFTVQGAYHAMKELMDQDPRPEAVFTSNNVLTLGALRFLRDFNYRIPDDIALACYDDPDWATVVDPPLTGVYARNYEMGSAAGEMMLDCLWNRGEKKNRRTVLSLALTVRKSCGCP